jgi:hypothetical protein
VEHDYAVSDTVELDPSLVGETPSQDHGAAEAAAKHLRKSRQIDWIDRIWLIDPATAQVVGDYRDGHFDPAGE